MVLAALIVSIAAVMVSGASAYYTRIQARTSKEAAAAASASSAAATRTADLADEQHHEELTPKVTNGELQYVDEKSLRLHFQLIDSTELTRIDAEIIEDSEVNIQFRPGAKGVLDRDANGRTLLAQYKPEFAGSVGKTTLFTGDAVSWLVRQQHLGDLGWSGA